MIKLKALHWHHSLLHFCIYVLFCFSCFAQDVPVYKMDGDILLSRENSSMMNFDINLHLYINERGSDVYGEGLWKVSAWLTGDPQDELRAYGFVDQVSKTK